MIVTGSRPASSASAHGAASKLLMPNEIYHAFKRIDVDDRGFITRGQFEDVCMKNNLSMAHATKLFEQIDEDGSGAIEFKEFMKAQIFRKPTKHAEIFAKRLATKQARAQTTNLKLSEIQAQKILREKVSMKFALALARKRLGGNGKESNCKSLYSAFQFFDANGSGTIDREEFGNAFDYLGIQMKEGEFEKILQAFEDVNGDGEIDYFEFVRSFAPSMTKVYK